MSTTSDLGNPEGHASTDGRGATVTDLERRVLDVIDSSGARLVELLRTLVAFATPNPPGANERDAQAWVAERLRDVGMTIDQFDALPDRPNVVGCLAGAAGGRSLLFNGHIDVAELRTPDAWTFSPFDAKVVDGRLYGLGSSDMKSSHAGFLLALESLRAAGVELAGDVIYESVIGEEMGEPGTQACVNRGIRADFAIVGECSKSEAIFVTSVGIVNACVTLTDPITQHLIQRRRMLRAGGQLVAANCIEKMATVVVPALLALEQEWGVFKEHPLLPPGQALINCFAIEGGGNTFILPNECRLYLTTVYLPNEQLDDVKAQVEDRLRAIAASDPWLRDHPPLVEWNPPRFPIEFLPIDGNPTDAGPSMLGECLGIVSGAAPVVGGRDAIMDGGWLAQAGIPTVVFGPGDKRVIHKPDEYVELDDVVVFAKTVALFMMRWCGVGGTSEG
jgi:acetylornithine deacetylase/succinyl-diaminopimelate desuccinylase family protein